MSDFLSRLAGRTMGLTPSVQPLVAPMYAHRSTPATEQSGLVPFDSDTNAPVGTGLAPVRAWAAPHPSAARDTHWAPGRLQGHAPTGGLPDNPLTAQTDSYQEMDGDRALPLQEEYTEGSHKNHPLPDNGSTSSHLFNTASQHNPGLAPASSEELKDGAFLLMHDHILPMDGSPQSNGSLPSSGEFSQSAMSAPDPLSMQDSRLSQRAWAGTSPRPYGQPHANDASEERRPIENVPGRAENELEGEHTTLQDWATLLPMQRVSGTEGGTSHAATARHGSLKRGNFGGITHQVEHDEIPPTGATTPSIQVTIGRIEVRATPPPPARSPAQRTVPSVMSLDDYINQRMKGGR